jgi:twitching motility protein PilT
MEDVNENTPLGQRIYQISQQVGISDYYITPWEPLCYKQNGELIYDTFVYQPQHDYQIQPGCHDYAWSFAGVRFRVNRMVTRGKYRWVMRLLPVEIPAPQDVSVPPAAIKSYLEAKNGLFLICGATGSGKSTTIASMIKHRAERRREHVITFEDPIEYIHPDGLPSLISQREMGEDEFDFGASLRASLRQAPATLADILRMILCQRLLKDEEKGKRFAIHELLLQYDSVSNLIRRGEFKKLDQELETGWKKGMGSFERSMEQRSAEGWKVPTAAIEESGFTADEVEDYLRNQNKI